MLYLKYTEISVFSIAVSFFLSLLPFISFSQETDVIFLLKGNTKLKDTNKGIEGVEIEVKKDGKTIKKILSERNGKYSLELGISLTNKNNEYLIYITQAGTIPKTLSINTYIPAEEFEQHTFPRYLFELPIIMLPSTGKEIILEKPSGRIIWDSTQHAFAFDQTFLKIKEDDTEKLLAAKKKKEEEEARKKAEDEARLKVEAEFDRLAELKAKEEAEKILQRNLAAMKAEMRKKRTRDSLDSIAGVNRGKALVEVVKKVKAASPEDVDPNAFDGTSTYAINIAKRSLKAAQEKMNREKAANLSAKYETNNTLTSLLNMVDEYEKKIKSIK